VRFPASALPLFCAKQGISAALEMIPSKTIPLRTDLIGISYSSGCNFYHESRAI
jgi:hypothetical protein